MINIKFAKVKPQAVIPSKTDENLGYDIYACFDEPFIFIPPHETKLIPTGIASYCDIQHGFLLRERGSTGSKGIALRAGVIDSGYRGEWFVGCTNTTDRDLYIMKKDYVDYNLFQDRALIYPYEKAIAQVIIVDSLECRVDEISYEDLKTIPSERGIGALGSSLK